MNNPNLRLKRAVDEILKWVAEVDQDPANRLAAGTAAQLVGNWRAHGELPDQPNQLSLFETPVGG